MGGNVNSTSAVGSDVVTPQPESLPEAPRSSDHHWGWHSSSWHRSTSSTSDATGYYAGAKQAVPWVSNSAPSYHSATSDPSANRDSWQWLHAPEMSWWSSTTWKNAGDGSWWSAKPWADSYSSSWKCSSWNTAPAIA